VRQNVSHAATLANLEEGRVMYNRKPWPTLDFLVSLPNEKLRNVDPLVMNLVVAKGIPAFANLDIERYVRLRDRWVEDIRQRLSTHDEHFYRSPEKWKNDIHFFRLGMVCWYVDEVLKIEYPDELADAADRIYTDPSNIFLNGLMDRRIGSCASMPVLHVALCWRLGWPVGLVCASHHLFCRYDDGQVKHNIEGTTFGRNGFRSHPDEYYREQWDIPDIAVSCGSDLCMLTAREMLGLFISIRGCHFGTIRRMREAEVDLLVARGLFPQSRNIYSSQMEVSIERGLRMFDRDEGGHPTNVGSRLREWLRVSEGLFENTISTNEVSRGNNNGSLRTEIIASGWQPPKQRVREV
jgi:hypothetical protein